MIGIALSQCCKFDQFLFGTVFGDDICHFKLAFGQCSGLIKTIVVISALPLIVASFYKDTDLRRCTDSSEES